MFSLFKRTPGTDSRFSDTTSGQNLNGSCLAEEQHNNVLMVGELDALSEWLHANIRQCNQNHIIPCYSNSVYPQLWSELKNNGYEIQVIDFENVGSEVQYHPFLKMQQVNGSYNHSIDEFVRPLVDCSQDPFFAECERLCFSLALGYLKMLPESEQTIDKLIEILSMGDNAADPVQPWVVLFGSVNHLQVYWKNYRKYANAKTHQSLCARLKSTVNALRVSKPALPADNLSLNWTAGKHALLIVYPDNPQQIQAELTMLYTQIVSAMQQQSLQYPVLIGIDERLFASHGSHYLSTTYSQMRFWVHTTNREALSQRGNDKTDVENSATSNKASRIEFYQHYDHEAKGFVAVIDGAKCQRSAEFLQAIWTALKFPGVCNHKWAAYSDWMRDLEWIDENDITIVIRNYADFLSAEPQSKEYFISSLQEVIFPYWENDAMDVLESKDGIKNITVICTDSQDDTVEIVPTENIVDIFAEKALNGRKTPHSVSVPVLRVENGDLFLSAFVFFYNREQLQSSMIKRPSMWILADLITGEISARYSCQDKDFSALSHEKLYNISDDGLPDLPEGYWAGAYAMLDQMRSDYVKTHKLNQSLYHQYLSKILDATPPEYQKFYEELSSVSTT